MELSSGTTVCGRFELLREESSNSGVPVFGPTWAVLDTESGEPARACVLDVSLLPTPAARAEFVKAVAGLADLRDGSLVPQLFVGEDAEHVIVCYDPLQGAFALGDLYEGTGSFDLRQEAGRLARQLARALALLHAQGRVHGMLANEAVFVGPRGPAVFQHGFAPLCARAELERRCKAFHLASLAPEVLRGGPFTPAADCYAWGVALARFVTGLRGEAAVTAPEPTGLPAGLWSVIQASLSAEPGARPQGGADLVRRLESLALGNGDPLELGEPPPPPAAPPPVLKDRTDPPAAPPPVLKDRTDSPAAPARPADARPTGSGPAGMSLPVTNLEDLLLTSPSPRRPGTIPPGSLTAAIDVDGKHPARSASGLRRVHVLTEDAIVRRPAGGEGTAPNEPSDVIIGGTKAELEAASRATTVRLDPPTLSNAVQAARRSGALPAATPNAPEPSASSPAAPVASADAPASPPSAAPSASSAPTEAPLAPPPPSAASRSVAPPKPPAPASPPAAATSGTDEAPRQGSSVLGLVVLALLAAGLLVWVLG